MLKVKGVNFYPRQIESLLLHYADVGSDYQIVVDKVEGKDQLSLIVEAKNPQDAALADCLVASVFDVLGFHADVQLVSIGQIARPVGKAVRVMDKRMIS